MNSTSVASELIRKHGVSVAAEKVAARVRTWASAVNVHPFALSRMRFWLGVDWQIHANRSLPKED
jgi:hypothetical protein